MDVHCFSRWFIVLKFHALCHIVTSYELLEEAMRHESRDLCLGDRGLVGRVMEMEQLCYFAMGLGMPLGWRPQQIHKAKLWSSKHLYDWSLSTVP